MAAHVSNTDAAVQSRTREASCITSSRASLTVPNRALAHASVAIAATDEALRKLRS